MTIFYKSAWKLRQLPAFLVCLFLFNAQQSWGQVPYSLAGGEYTESFDNIAGWGASFTSGIGAQHFGVAPVQSPLPTSTTVFTINTAGGVQRVAGAIALLATGTTDGASASAFDLYLDFTGVSAGSISLNWAQISNSTGDRRSTFKLQTNTGAQGAFVDLAGSAVVVTNNVASSGSLTSIALPAEFAGKADAKIRFFLVTSSGGATGSRPKISLDDIRVTTNTTDTPPAPTTAIATTASTFNSPYCISASNGSAPFSVAYTSNGAFTGTFKVQLSNAAGAFPANVTDNIIGSGNSSPLSAVIPAGTPSGTRYRIRVVNDAPATFGTNNGTDLAINLTSDSNPVTVTPATAQTVAAAGTGATLTASAAAGSAYAWLYGTSAAGPYSSAIGGATSASYTVKAADFAGAGTYYLVAQATSTTTCGTATGVSAPVTITVSAPPTTPALNVSASSLPSFGELAVGAGTALKSFTVGGNNLSGSILITPPAGFEIRTGNAPFACCAIELQPAGGSVPTTTIDVRFAPTVTQSYSEAIPVTSAGLPNQTVAVTGTGINATYPATLTTTPITALTSTGASTGGTIEADGGSAVTARGVVWATSVNPTLGANRTTNEAGTGAFSSAIEALLPGTTYYVRAYATTNMGTAYGQELSFTTVTVPLAAEPTTPATLTASQVTTTSLQLDLKGGNGQKRLVIARLGSAVDAVPTDATTYSADAAFGKGSVLGTGNFVVYNGTGDNVTVTELRANTPYHFAVFSFNDNNTPYAENYLTTTPGTLTQATPGATAALLLEENFDYAANSPLTDNGWSAHSGGTTNAISATAASLSYADYGASNIGRAATMTTTGQDVNHRFAAVYARTPVYVSFLVKVNSAGAADYFFHLGPTSLGSNFKARILARRGSGADKVQFGITGNGTNIEWGTAEYAAGAAASTYLLVVKYVFDEAGSTSELFVNPAVGAEPTAAIAAVTETTGSPTDIGTVVLRQGSSTPNLVIDGIRVGTTYRAVRLGLVCEEPVPAFTAPAGCAGSPVAFTDASTVVEANATYAWDVDSDGKVDYTTRGSISHIYAAAGTYTATLTITQGTCSTTSTRQVTVNALPEPTITATPANQVYTGGVPTNLYLGYGPQSLTLTAAGGVTYRWAGPAGLSATNTASPVFTATKAGTFTYTVTVTNQLGCSATKSVTISVVEVRDGNKGNPKIMVCHNGKGVYVNANEVESHLLGHKEQLGDCSGNAAKAAATVSAVTTESAPASVFEAYPNPFTERAAIRFRLTETSKAQLVVLNSVGQVVATLYSGEAEKGRDYEFALEGTTLPQGIYTCRLTTNGKVETKRLVLAK